MNSTTDPLGFMTAILAALKQQSYENERPSHLKGWHAGYRHAIADMEAHLKTAKLLTLTNVRG